MYTKGGIGAPNELATFRVHDGAVDFVERSVWRTRKYAASNPISAREILKQILANICLRISQAHVGQNRREEWIFPGILESLEKQIYKIGPIGDLSGKVWLGSLETSNFWPSIVAGLSTPSFRKSIIGAIEFAVQQGHHPPCVSAPRLLISSDQKK